MDIVRVSGNNAVHPGEIDLKDDYGKAIKLFQLVNLIADYMIAKPKEIENMFDDLPDSVKKNIHKRNKV